MIAVETPITPVQSGSVVLAVVLSLVAALLFAVASVLQQKGTQNVSDDNALGAGFLVSLAKRGQLTVPGV